jgi:predicted RecA/RadA family phage recombinase
MGQGAKASQLFGVATGDAAIGTDVALKVSGVFDLTKIANEP